MTEEVYNVCGWAMKEYSDLLVTAQPKYPQNKGKIVIVLKKIKDFCLAVLL